MQKFESWTGQLRNKKIEKFKKNLVGQQNIFVKSNEEAEEIFRASYIVSKKKSRILEDIFRRWIYEKVLDRTRGYFVSRRKKTFAEVSLSRETVERQIDAIAVIVIVASGKVVETSVAFSFFC